MSWDSVPWFVGGGALHSPEVARLLAYAATSGAEGVVTSGELKVTPLDIPGTKVRVLAGAALILNRAQGGADQTYAGRLGRADDVDVASTGSAGGRRDLVIARVEDPFMPGEPWSEPDDPSVGPYIFSRVIPNVPASAIASHEAATAYIADQGWSAIPLAGINLPASTGTITGDLITDLRQVARPREKSWHAYVTGMDIDHTATTMMQWSPFAPKVTVPTWATHATMKVTLSGAINYSGATVGVFQDRLGTAIGPNINWDLNDVANANNPARHDFIIPAIDLDVSAMQGQSVTAALFAQTDQGVLSMRGWGVMLIEITFQERTV